jgi:hypothetical protein
VVDDYVGLLVELCAQSGDQTAQSRAHVLVHCNQKVAAVLREVDERVHVLLHGRGKDDDVIELCKA